MIDLGDNLFRPDAFSGEPLEFLTPRARNDLAVLTEIDLVENGDAAARRSWQNRLLTSLLRHAQQRSKFWRSRILAQHPSHETLNMMPTLSRADLMQQVKSEGSLMAGMPGADNMTYKTSGSTGTPVEIYYCQQNSRYNSLRSMAQYFIDGMSLAHNRVQLAYALVNAAAPAATTFRVETSASWTGSLGSLFASGHSKNIKYYSNDLDMLVQELLKDDVGYLVCAGGHVDNLIAYGGVDLLKKMRINAWLQVSDGKDADRSALLADAGIPTLANYSCSETGPIACECKKAPGNFHVVHSNVLVETDPTNTVEMDGEVLARILITHLHSYATPLIRYDLGDFGKLQFACPCGHSGQTLSNIFGRKKSFLRHPDGKLLPFYLGSRLIPHATNCIEYSLRQTDPSTIVLQVVMPTPLTDELEKRLRSILSHWFDDAFTLVIKSVDRVDWGNNSKRLSFISDVV